MMSDSSESSADEEDRRLKPIRPRQRTGNQISTIDACDEPEAFTTLELGTGNENMQHRPFSNLDCVGTLNSANSFVFHDGYVHEFLPNVMNIAADTESSHNLIFGLRIIQQMFDSQNPLSANADINSVSSVKEESSAVHEVELSNVTPKVILGPDKAADFTHRSFKDAGSQTVLTGDYIPQNMDQMIEHLQLIWQDTSTS